MRRWQAIPVAALVALAVATALFVQPIERASAGQTLFEMSIDCAPGGAIDSSCNPAGSPQTVDVVMTNNSGFTVSISALGWTVVNDNSALFQPPTVAPCIAPSQNCNPDLNETGGGGALSAMNCSAPPPTPDLNVDGDPGTTESFLGCNTGAPPAPFFADGTNFVLGSVTYNVVGTGVADFSLKDVSMFDDTFSEMMSCNPVITLDGTCTGATMQIGGSAATNTPQPTSTNTPLPTATCDAAQGQCATATSEAFVTVTPTASVTPPGGGATPVPSTPAPQQPGQPGQPGGTTGGGGRGPITLPDTGTGANESMNALTIALIALGAGVIAGGAYFGAAAVKARRRNGED